MTQLRKNYRTPSHSSITDAMADTIQASAPSEDVEILRTAIARLTEVEKAIMLLYMDEYSYKEIGDITGLTESNVGFRINTIKKKLKSIINR